MGIELTDQKTCDASSPAVKRTGRGFLLWGAFIVVMSIGALYAEPMPPGTGMRVSDFSYDTIIASSSSSMKLLSIVGAFASFGVCVLFYYLSHSRQRRHLIARLFGLLCFAFASGMPYVGFCAFAEGEVLEARGLSDTFGGIERAYFTLPFALVLSVVFGTMAYFLLFRRGKQHARFTEGETMA